MSGGIFYMNNVKKEDLNMQIALFRYEPFSTKPILTVLPCSIIREFLLLPFSILMEHLKNSLFKPFVTGTICIASMVLMDLCLKYVEIKELLASLQSASKKK